MSSPSTRPSNKALLGRVRELIDTRPSRRELIDTRPSRLLNHYHFDLFLLYIRIWVEIRTSTDVMTFFFLFFALHLILSSYFDVVDTRIRTRPSNVVNTRSSASPSNFP